MKKGKLRLLVPGMRVEHRVRNYWRAARSMWLTDNVLLHQRHEHSLVRIVAMQHAFTSMQMLHQLATERCCSRRPPPQMLRSRAQMHGKPLVPKVGYVA